VIETLTTERVIPLGTNKSPASQCFYHWVDTSAGELLVPKGITRSVVSVSITGSNTLTTERVIPLGTNSSPAEVSTQ
jgi:hypothetical protein